MGAGPHGNAAPVDHHRDIVGVNALKLKGEDTALVRRVADDAQRIDLAQPLGGVSGKIGLVCCNRGAAEIVHVIERVTEADRLHDGRRPRFETMRRLVIGDIVFGNVEDHLAAALERLHLAQPVRLAVEHADARGTIKLVAGHHIPVAIDIAHIHRHVNRALRAINKHRNAALMRDAAYFLDRNDGAERIRHMGDGNELGAFRQALFESLDMKRAVIIDGHPNELGALPFADEMPRHDVGVVLHDRDDDLVALADLGHAVAIGNRIDRLGRGFGEDDLVHRTGVQEPAHFFARRFIGVGCGIGEEMQAAMHVCVLICISMRNGVDHHLRLLSGRAVVEIDQRLAIDLARQDREILAHGFDVIRGRHCGLVHFSGPFMVLFWRAPGFAVVTAASRHPRAYPEDDDGEVAKRDAPASRK
ncbi:hypothetical protein AT6N2_C0356 [Agrobacterium tumefaciens]|nr:hypothetical protein AT6N2_C0356 [Agrobacterium tumefaciens]